jgi:cell division protein FtsL
MTAQAMPYSDRRTRGFDHDLTGVTGPRIFPLVFFVLGVVVVFFSMIFLRISLDETAFKLDRIETEIAGEQSRQLDLRYDLAGLQDPLRIATEAQRIGLVYPQERISIVMTTFVNDGQILVVDVPVRAMAGDRP